MPGPYRTPRTGTHTTSFTLAGTTYAPYTVWDNGWIIDFKTLGIEFNGAIAENPGTPTTFSPTITIKGYGHVFTQTFTLPPFTFSVDCAASASVSVECTMVRYDGALKGTYALQVDTVTVSFSMFGMSFSIPPWSVANTYLSLEDYQIQYRLNGQGSLSSLNLSITSTLPYSTDGNDFTLPGINTGTYSTSPSVSNSVNNVGTLFVPVTPSYEVELRALDTAYSGSHNIAIYDGGLPGSGGQVKLTATAAPTYSGSYTTYGYYCLITSQTTSGGVNSATTPQCVSAIEITDSQKYAPTEAFGYVSPPTYGIGQMLNRYPIGTAGQPDHLNIESGDTVVWTGFGGTTVTQTPSVLTLTSPGGGPGNARSATYIGTPNGKASQGYRYLRFRVKSLVGSNQPFQVYIQSSGGDSVLSGSGPLKIYDGQTGTAGTFVNCDIDLCIPSNVPGVGADTTQNHNEPEGWLWGVNGFVYIWLQGLTAGETYVFGDGSVAPISLVRKNYCQMSFGDAGSFQGDCDGRTIGGANGSRSGEFSPAYFNGNLQWTVVPATSFPDPGFTFANSVLAASGAYYDYVGGSFSHPWRFDISSAVTLYAQDASFEVGYFPECGNIFDYSSSFGGGPTIAASANLRGSSMGVVAYLGSPLGSETVTADLQIAPATSVGTATTDANGIYYLSTPYAWANVLVKANNASQGYTFWGGGFPGGNRFRLSFYAGPVEKKPFHRHDANGRLHVASVINNDAYYKRADFSMPWYGWAVTSQMTSYGDVTGVSFGIEHSNQRFIHALVERLTVGVYNLYSMFSTSQGADWSSPTLFMANALAGLVITLRRGKIIQSWFEYNSGTSGPGTRYGMIQEYPGGPFGTPFQMCANIPASSGGSAVSLEDGGWGHIEESHQQLGALTWTCTENGNTSTSYFMSFDLGMSWLRVT